MDDVIETKFVPPVWLGSQIRRDVLLDRLDHALTHRLTLISAPAGYGKTSLLSQWREALAARDVDATWLTLDRGDGDLQHLTRCLLHATLGSDAQVSDDLPPRSAVSAIVKALGASERMHVLILDDLHHAASEPVFDLLRTLIRRAYAHCRFVFATRDIPRLGQSALAAEGQLLELSADDLRFSRAEAEELLGSGGRDMAASEAVGRIMERTEGWPIAVRLSTLSLEQGRGELLDNFAGTRAELARYLSEHVLMALPEDDREIVLRTAMLDRLDGDSVNLVCEREDGWLVLERLERRGVFLSPDGPAGTAYRYHQLFAEYLRDRFARSQPAAYTALARRLAQWQAGRGQLAEAVDHAANARDYDLLAGIIEEAGGWRLIPRGLQGVVERALRHLPPALVSTRPRLVLAKVYLQLKLGELGSARADFDRLQRQAGETGFSADLEIEMRVVGDTLADYENRPVTFEDLLTREALVRKLPADDHLVLANITETLGAKYFEGGWLERALQPTLVARDHYQAFGSIYSDLFTRFLEARIMRAQGRSKDSVRILAAARATIHEHFGERCDLAANCAAYQAELDYEQDLRSQAEEELAWALPHMEQFDGWVDVYAAAYFTQARTLAARGAFEDAWDLIARARRTASRRRLLQLELLAGICEIDLRVAHGGAPDAIARASEALGLDALADMMTQTSPQYRPVAVAAALCRARLALTQERHQAALAELAALQAWAAQHGAGRMLIDVNILAAYGHRLAGAEDLARASFDEAVGIAMFQDISRPFIDARLFVHPCLDDALAEGRQVDRYRDQFLKGLERSISGARNTVTAQGVFSEAEAEVLNHLVHGRSNKEIARLIGMSPDTVKYRLKSVFRKIGVNKRRDAIRVSLERGLVSIGTAA